MSAQRRLLDMLIGWEDYATAQGYYDEGKTIAKLYQEAGRIMDPNAIVIEEFVREKVLPLLLRGEQ